MSVIIGAHDLTSFITQGGINESLKKVDSSTEESKGAHYSYSLSAQVPEDIKTALSGYLQSNSVQCSVDGIEFNAEMTDFSATIYVEIDDISLWNISFTVTDLSLTDEQEAEE